VAEKILVWDMPTRVFHWLLALCFAGAFLTGDTERFRDLHVLFGYTLLGLIGFRLLWGVVGSRYARFSAFTFDPSSLWTYLRSLLTAAPAHYIGHNPAGSWMIIVILALGVLTGVTGYALDNELGGEWLEELHEGTANAMLAVVLAHIAGVIVSSIRHRENLLQGMVTGYKTGAPAAGIRQAHGLLGLGLLAGVIAFWVWWL